MNPRPSTSRADQFLDNQGMERPSVIHYVGRGGIPPRVCACQERSSERFRIINTTETFVRRFRVHGLKLIFKFNQPPTGVSELDWVRQGFADIVEKAKEVAAPTDYVGFTLRSLNFKSNEPGYLAFRPASEVEPDELWSVFGGIIQSNSGSITSSDTFEVELTKVSLPRGSGKVRSGLYNNFDEECAARKAIITIKNTDNLCLPRALVVAKAKAKNDPEYKAIRQDRRRRQTTKARKLMEKAGVTIPQDGAGIPELELFHRHLKKYNIVVYTYEGKGREVLFSGYNNGAEHTLNLIYKEGHYNVITRLPAAFGSCYFCKACHAPHDHVTRHMCKDKCPACMKTSPPCTLEGEGVTCTVCRRHFKNLECLAAHSGEVCTTFKKCEDCGRLCNIKKRKTPHVCGEIYCRVCADFKAPNHRCYMCPDKADPPNEDFAFIFFDLETRQDEDLDASGVDKVHKVNLCASQQFCWRCIGGEVGPCNCSAKIFDGVEPILEFMNYVMDERKRFKKCCVIAHNGQGFDFQFILKFILEKTKFTPELITRGTKIILMELDNVRFVDSLNYFPMALSALPKAFDLPPEKKKGYFPHLFNSLQNQNYVGPMPAKEYYCPDTMFEKPHREFENWYNEQVRSNYIFDFKKELIDYCVSDVDILAQACIKFRALLLEQCNVDPFLEAVTIASACNLAFRRNFLQPQTIGLLPKNGYRLVDNQSSIALQWLCWEEENLEDGEIIQHAGRQREVRVAGMKVDGFVEEGDSGRVYEFYGCYFHGCPKCYPYKRQDHLKEDPSDTMDSRYQRTLAKAKRLRDAGYDVSEMWECTFRTLKKQEGLGYLEHHPVLNTLPLDPREAFFGGRTGNSRNFHVCQEGEEIHYADVCSLYPYVCKYGKYPVGHPTVYVGDKDCRRLGMNAEGLLKCKVLPPQQLYHPVLPTRMHDKLMFVLCRKCGEDQLQDDCTHDDEERSLVGTWTMDEIRKAVSRGYVVKKMYELWQYEMANIRLGNGLFTEFINKFLKLKQEASGYPTWCRTEEDKKKYVDDYCDRDGIRLDPDYIAKNAGLRSLAKLMLNSFWGKFGQRQNQTKSLITRNPEEFFRLISNPAVCVNRLQDVNQETLLVNWQYRDEVGESLRTVNVVLAAYTTAQARLKLYEYLEALDRQVLYYDTDSVIYTYKNGQHRVPTGDYLGEMTDELEEYGPGSYIKEFVSGGPKTYAYNVWSTLTNSLVPVCKVKGLTLNLHTAEQLNFTRLKDMVLSQESGITLPLTETRIKRTDTRQVITSKQTKVFRITGPKRKSDEGHDTLPYGYRKRPRL